MRKGDIIAVCVCGSAGLEIISADLRHKNWTQEHTALRPLLWIRGFSERLGQTGRQHTSTIVLFDVWGQRPSKHTVIVSGNTSCHFDV